MKVTFLGTGTSQGVPVIACKCSVCTSSDFRDERLRTSIWVQVNDLSLVVDTGPDFRQQMLRAKVETLDAVLFTHEHKDHIAGLDDIRAFNFILGKRIDVFATAHVQEHIRREFPYIFAEFKYPGIPEIDLHEIPPHQKLNIKGTQITPIDLLHYKLPVLGFRIGDFSYVTDANFISEDSKAKIKNSKVLVLNALRREKHISHFNLQEALDLVSELNPEVCYLTHISHQLGLHQEVQAELPENVFLAYDGLQITI